MATLAELRKLAKEEGIEPKVIKSASSSTELQKIIDAHLKGGSTTATKKRVVKKKSAVAKKKSGNSKTAKKTSTKKTTAKKSGNVKKSTTTKSNGYVAKGGRNTLDGVDYTETEGWNPREGSAPDRIVKALRRFKGNRSKVFDFLASDVWDFVGKKMADGSKRSKPDAEAMLRYRISRTAWDFALRTGQHEAAANRVEYGTGGTGEGVFKRRKSGSAKKATAKKSSKKSGTKKSTAKKSGRKSASRKR